MKQILIACDKVDVLRRIVGDLPDGQFEPIATRTGAGIVQKIADRDVPVAIIHEHLADDSAADLCAQLHRQPDGPAILWLADAAAPADGPFDRALSYPLPGPVLRNALTQLVGPDDTGYDLQRWREFYRELQQRLADIDEQTYFQILGISPDAGHQRLVDAYDVLSQRYHPDRYRQFRAEKWGEAIHQHATQLYKVITEAYQVLADRKLRRAYQQAVDDGQLRLGDQDSPGNDAGPSSLVDLGKTGASKKFLKLAQSDLAGQNLAGAVQNLRFAQSMEPDNRAIAKKIAQIEQNIG